VRTKNVIVGKIVLYFVIPISIGILTPQGLSSHFGWLGSTAYLLGTFIVSLKHPVCQM